MIGRGIGRGSARRAVRPSVRHLLAAIALAPLALSLRRAAVARSRREAAIALHRAQLAELDRDLADVHELARTLAQHVHPAGGGEHLRGRDLQQGRLAGAVGSQDHPALVDVDVPVHRVQQHRRPAP